MSVRFDLENDVATVTVDRPDHLNALDWDTLAGLGDAVATARDRGAGCLVLTGAGDEAFVAGADVAGMAEFGVEEAHEFAALGHDVADALAGFPAPTIAAINGYAFGGGCELALACDLRVAATSAELGQTEIDLGIIPGWGGTQRLPRLVGDELARRMVFFGDRLDAQDAHEAGLVGEVVADEEFDDHVASLAVDLAAKPTVALHAAKEAISQAHETTLDAGLAFERRAWASLFGTPDQAEGMAAFLEDRDPQFE